MKKNFLAFLLFFMLPNIYAAEPKSAAKSKTDLAAKAAEDQRLKEEREDEYEEKNRWIWRYTLKNDEVYWLHTSNRPTACKGKLQAVKTRWQLNEHETIQELCWHKKSGDTYITIVDPQAYLMSTTKIDAAKFDYIPSKKEKKAAALAERNRQMRDAILEDYSRARRDERDRLERVKQQLLRPPMICHDTGDMLLCD
jgi:hypothetical protein